MQTTQEQKNISSMPPGEIPDEAGKIEQAETMAGEVEKTEIAAHNEDKTSGAPATISGTEAVEDQREQARQKLKNELEAAEDKAFAKPVLDYLQKRCAEDTGMAADVMQEHKTWKECFDYIIAQARKQASGSRQCAVRDETVYEWAEDYYRRDDKALQKEEKKESSTAAQKKLPAAKVKKTDEKKPGRKNKKPQVDVTVNVSLDQHKEEPALKGKTKDIDGQMSMFDFL